MLKRIFATALVLSVCAIPGAAGAGMLTTSFASNNSFDGNMFDVNILSGTGLTVTGLDVNIDASPATIEVWTIVGGTYVGSESGPAGWNLVSSTAVVGVGTDLPTAVDVADFFLPTGASALYITTQGQFLNGDAGMNYINGNSEGSLFVSNADLQIFEGIGKEYFLTPGGGDTFRPRNWSGTVYYDLGPGTPDIPEPTTLVLLGLGLAGVGAARRRKK